jgi:flavin reductase (DIM6/NTAB) family NADH-FMN oxidoreductase RutF
MHSQQIIKIMKQILLTLLIICALTACSNKQNAGEESASTAQSDSLAQADDINVADKTFDELFTEITPDKIDKNIIDLIKTYNIVITAGGETDYNSMVAGDGGIGLLMGKPVTFCGLRGSRYTLEIILKDSVYTWSFFDDKYRDDYIIFGQISGKDSEKMKESKLTAVATPTGKMSFKEAFMIIECRLAQTHTVNLPEVYAEKNHKFFEDAYKEVGSYHKIVFGDITDVWIKK